MYHPLLDDRRSVNMYVDATETRSRHNNLDLFAICAIKRDMPSRTFFILIRCFIHDATAAVNAKPGSGHFRRFARHGLATVETLRAGYFGDRAILVVPAGVVVSNFNNGQAPGLIVKGLPTSVVCHSSNQREIRRSLVYNNDGLKAQNHTIYSTMHKERRDAGTRPKKGGRADATSRGREQLGNAKKHAVMLLSCRHCRLLRNNYLGA